MAQNVNIAARKVMCIDELVTLIVSVQRLATNRYFLLGVWLEDAKAIPVGDQDTKEVSELYEFNARNQITLWGPNGEILDYATKQWSGILSFVRIL